METVSTSFGDVPIEKLRHLYETYKQNEEKKAEKRRAFLQTEEGKIQNRKRAKEYYERNRDVIKAKAKAKYIPKKARAPPSAPGTEKNETPGAEA